MSAWDDTMGWLKNAGDNAYSWAGDNPLQALSLGAGAFGTGAGIWDAYQANQRAVQRQKLAEQYAKMGPSAFAPNYSPNQLQAMYFRPAAQNMAERGQTQGGAFNAALADAALKAEADRIQLGNQIFQSRVGSLGYGPPLGATGNTGAFGGSLQNLILANAMKRYPAPQYQQPGAATFQMPNMGTGYGAENEYAAGWQPSQALGAIPNMQLQGGGMPGWAQNAAPSLTDPLANWSPSSAMGSQSGFYPQGSMSELY